MLAILLVKYWKSDVDCNENRIVFKILGWIVNKILYFEEGVREHGCSCSKSLVGHASAFDREAENWNIFHNG